MPGSRLNHHRLNFSGKLHRHWRQHLIGSYQLNIDGRQKSTFDGAMKTKTIWLVLAFCFLAGAACFGADPHMGTWKLNAAKSKITPGTLIFHTIIYKSMFGKVKVEGEGIDADGKSVHTKWTGNFDGKDYPVTGDPISDSRSYTKVDDRTLDLTVKKGGKIIDTVRMVLSADGRSRTVTVTGTTPKGKKFKNVVVYDKQ
jgi:hypothetical protein